ncbi:hypothetical protein [Morganella morganii]|uniref:hypothetical protein n=1 Tax=Morganella morganii TaxID=582 RepID=UPI00053747B8|nr:hypothetical protein [Morganella morganii]AUT98744.1 hypothetical protein MC49_000395 [Morganella morganii]
MKVKLLNNGGFIFSLGGIKFPVVVEASNYRDVGFDVLGDELIKAGGIPDIITPDDDYFFTNDECEVINEQIS